MVLELVVLAGLLIIIVPDVPVSLPSLIRIPRLAFIVPPFRCIHPPS